MSEYDVIFFIIMHQVRSSDATWSDTRRNLRKDHRWESASLLEREEKEKLFNEHIEALAKKKKEQFRQLLDETSMVVVLPTSDLFVDNRGCLFINV